jgi:uncharacterized protein (TIGR01319 family)
MSAQQHNVILATDCGSTTTKAILIEKRPEGYRLTCRGEAPTTVESPFEDVTRGVLNAVEEVQELTGRQLLDGERLITPAQGNKGVDIYISTSSAGGGLQMLVAGAVKTMTAESAQRAALGAGAIVMDVIAMNDGRLPHEKIARIRELSPDMILLSGGTDGGTVSHVVELAEFIAAARPEARLGHGFKLPVIYAGNRDARDNIRQVLGEITVLTVTDNIRPTLERENLAPARQCIQQLFLEHVMAHAPGYDKLIGWTNAPIMPTPAAVGLIMQSIARRDNIDVIGVDIGGATTDVFSIFGGVFNRTVSANLGLSYSVSNVLTEAGMDRVLRWMPMRFDPEALHNRVKNKMIRPTSIPQTLTDLMLEQALAREALALAFDQHRLLATGLKGMQRQRDISEAFTQAASGSLVDMSKLDLLVGSGGVLSHAPRRAQAMMMLIDAFQPEGVTELAVDSIFMMPHLGVLSQVNEQAAVEVFERDCLVRLGTCIAAAPGGRTGKECMRYRARTPSGEEFEGDLPFGKMLRVPAREDEWVEVEVSPARGVDVGAGKSVRLVRKCRGGQVGVVLDARGRPIHLPEDQEERRTMLVEWLRTMDVYPKKAYTATAPEP